MQENFNPKEIQIDGWRAYDLPVKYSYDDYEEARQEVIKKAKQSPELAALFEFGCIPALGISDMDFWAVFPDNCEKMHIPGDPPLSEKTRHIMSHLLVAISEKHYKKMLYFDPWTMNAWPNGHKLLYQKEDTKRDLNFEKINFTDEEKQALSISYLEEKLESIYPLIPLLAKKELPVRKVFESIKDCVYMMREVNLFTGRKIENNFVEDFNNLRSNWFLLEKEAALRKLIELLQQALLIGFEVAFSISNWLESRCEKSILEDIKIKKTNLLFNSFLDKKYKNIYLATFKTRRVYSSFIENPVQALELSLNSYKNIEINFKGKRKKIDFYISFQPYLLSGIPLGLARVKGLLSETLRKDMYTNTNEIMIFNPKSFEEKNKMRNEIAEIYDKKQSKRSLCKGYLFGINHFGYYFTRESYKRKILTVWLKYKFWRSVNKVVKSDL